MRGFLRVGSSLNFRVPTPISRSARASLTTIRLARGLPQARRRAPDDRKAPLCRGRRSWHEVDDTVHFVYGDGTGVIFPLLSGTGRSATQGGPVNSTQNDRLTTIYNDLTEVIGDGIIKHGVTPRGVRDRRQLVHPARRRGGDPAVRLAGVRLAAVAGQPRDGIRQPGQGRGDRLGSSGPGVCAGGAAARPPVCARSASRRTRRDPLRFGHGPFDHR